MGPLHSPAVSLGTWCLIIGLVTMFSLHEAVGQAMTMDEMIVDAANSTSEFEFFYDEKNSLLKVELDMLFTMDEWADYQSVRDPSNTVAGKKKRSAGIINGRGGGYRWPNKVIPYEMYYGTFSSYDQSQITAAMDDWMRYTCVTFRQATGQDRNRIRFQNGQGKNIVTHEVGHALGLHHEQTRPDRDEYVTIIKQNIPSSLYYNFEKYTWDIIQEMGVPYDYTSIMHYGSTAFSMNGAMTIKTKDPKYQNIIGNRHRLSFGDIKAINIMYNCKEAKSGCTKSDSECPGQGFVGKDCQCWCPGDPYVLCTEGGGGGGGGEGGGGGGGEGGGGTGGGGTGGGGGGGEGGGGTGGGGGGGETCTDSHASCVYWSRVGECQRNPAWMNINCKRSCNQCEGGGGGGGGEGGGGGGEGGGTINNCIDLNANCQRWAAMRLCSGVYGRYMMGTCRRSCNMCSASHAAAAATCADQNAFCQYWSSTNQCNTNPAYMHQWCKRSCGIC